MTATVSARRAATNALRDVLAALLSACGNAPGQAGAELRRQIGILSADTADRVEAGDFAEDLAACFVSATAAGATFDGMDRVRLVAMAYGGDAPLIRRVVQTCVRYALVEMSRILSVTTFVSRQDIDTATQRINAAFEPAESFAADQRNNVVFRALVSLHAATTRDLTQRSRQLPRVVPFSFPRRIPALSLANRLYGDGSRSSELIAANRVVHPLFTAGSGLALAR